MEFETRALESETLLKVRFLRHIGKPEENYKQTSVRNRDVSTSTRRGTDSIHRLHEGKALSHRFFFRRQFKHTRGFLAVSCGGEDAGDIEATDIFVLQAYHEVGNSKLEEDDCEQLYSKMMELSMESSANVNLAMSWASCYTIPRFIKRLLIDNRCM